MSNITDHYLVFNVIEIEKAIVENVYIEINKRMLKDVKYVQSWAALL